MSSRTSSKRLRPGPSGVSRSARRTRFTPDRASRSASSSAFAASRKAEGGRSETPKNRARPPLANVSRPSLTVTNPRRPGRGFEQAREVEGRLRGDRRRGPDRLPAFRVRHVMVRGPFGLAADAVDHHIIDPEGAERLLLLEVDQGPGGGGAGRPTDPRIVCQPNVPENLRAATPSVIPGRGTAVVVEEEDEADRARLAAEAVGPGGGGDLQPAELADRDAEARVTPGPPRPSARRRRWNGCRGMTGGRRGPSARRRRRGRLARSRH